MANQWRILGLLAANSWGCNCHFRPRGSLPWVSFISLSRCSSKQPTASHTSMRSVKAWYFDFWFGLEMLSSQRWTWRIWITFGLRRSECHRLTYLNEKTRPFCFPEISFAPAPSTPLSPPHPYWSEFSWFQEKGPRCKFLYLIHSKLGERYSHTVGTPECQMDSNGRTFSHENWIPNTMKITKDCQESPHIVDIILTIGQAAESLESFIEWKLS